jgi:hypothetical protein
MLTVLDLSSVYCIPCNLLHNVCRWYMSVKFVAGDLCLACFAILFRAAPYKVLTCWQSVCFQEMVSPHTCMQKTHDHPGSSHTVSCLNPDVQHVSSVQVIIRSPGGVFRFLKHKQFEYYVCSQLLWVTSDFLLSAVYSLAKSGVNIFTLILSKTEICVQQKFCELRYTEHRHSTLHAKQTPSVVCAVQFPDLKALKVNTELSFILEREDYQRTFFIVTECTLYLLKCVCPCVQVCMCISNNDAFIKTSYFCSE